MSHDRRPVVVVGSINVDFVVTAPRIPVVGETLTGSQFQTHFGGKGANQAVAVARLGYPVEMIGMVGTDIFGHQVKHALQSVGVGVSAIGTAQGTSGIATITVSDSGDNAIIVVPGANAQVTPEYVEQHELMISQAGIVLAQLEIPIATVERLAELCRLHRVPLILDPAPARNLPLSIFDKIDWFTPNQTEAAAYVDRKLGHRTDSLTHEQIAVSILTKGCCNVVLKLGSQGAYLAEKSGKTAVVPAFSVDVVDTTAAGDAFNAGFATGLMMGKSNEESATFAAAVAAISVTRAGAQASMPRLAEVELFLETERLQRSVVAE